MILSYNPVRAQNFNKTKRPKSDIDVNAGTKHSDIVKRDRIGNSLLINSKVYTKHGVSAELFNGKFVVRAEVLGAGNSLGTLINEDKDRVVLVKEGILWVTVGESTQVPTRLTDGAYFVAYKGIKYSLSSDGKSNVELVFIEEPDYASSVTVLSEGCVRIMDTSVIENNTEDISIKARRADSSLAKEASVALASTRTQRRQKRPNFEVATTLTASANSAEYIGVSPKPLGAEAFGDE